MAEAAIFTCSICGERSSEICVYCTKDACGNHRCERCKRCSDCCECEIPLSAAEAPAAEAPAASEMESSAEPEIEPATSPAPRSEPVAQPGEDISPPLPENLIT